MVTGGLTTGVTTTGVVVVVFLQPPISKNRMDKIQQFKKDLI